MTYAVQAGAVDQFTFGSLCLLLLLILSAFFIVVAVFMLFASTSFWFEDRVGMVPPVYNLMEFGRWPVGIFHWMVKGLVTFLIPFSFTAFYPASIFLSTAETDPSLAAYAIATPMVAIVSMVVATSAWRQGLKRYHSPGN